MFVRFIHIIACSCSSFIFITIHIPLVNIPQFIYSLYCWMGIWVISRLELLWIVLLWIFLYLYFGEHMYTNSFNPEFSCNCYPICFPLELSSSKMFTLLSNTCDSLIHFLVRYSIPTENCINHVYSLLIIIKWTPM